MTSFDRVVVIFNLQSAGEAPQLAEKLRTDLANRLPRMSVSLNPTERADHAWDLAREAAGVGRPLIVSVSGDGGYNEVVDGVMQADNDDVVCAVMAADNANDHRRMTRERPLADAVVAGEVRRIDLLRLAIGSGDDARTQFAHYWNGSDSGRRGRSPEGQRGLIQGDRVDGRTFARFRPFTIELEDGHRQSFDSLLSANISEMAKYASLSEDGRPNDGQFEVITLPHTAKWRVLGVAMKAATRGLGPQPTATHYGFTTLKPIPLQLDGELLTLDADTAVSVDIVPRALATVS